MNSVQAAAFFGQSNSPAVTAKRVSSHEQAERQVDFERPPVDRRRKFADDRNREPLEVPGEFLSGSHDRFRIRPLRLSRRVAKCFAFPQDRRVADRPGTKTCFKLRQCSQSRSRVGRTGPVIQKPVH